MANGSSGAIMPLYMPGHRLVVADLRRGKRDADILQRGAGLRLPDAREAHRLLAGVRRRAAAMFAGEEQKPPGPSLLRIATVNRFLPGLTSSAVDDVGARSSP